MSLDAVLDAAARKNGGVLSFRDFSELALFAPEYGYYARKRERVGTAEGTDFYTSATMGAVFGKARLTCGKPKASLPKRKPFAWATPSKFRKKPSFLPTSS